MFGQLFAKVGLGGELPNYSVETNTAFTHHHWDVFDGTRRQDAQRVSVWLSQDPNPPASQLTSNCQCLKLLRHPYILRIFDYVESSAKKGCVYLITERVRPLEENSARDNVWGLFQGETKTTRALGRKPLLASALLSTPFSSVFSAPLTHDLPQPLQILTALNFLHSSSRTHNLVDFSAILVTENKNWRLGAFELSVPATNTDARAALAARKSDHKLRPDGCVVPVFDLDVRPAHDVVEYLDLVGVFYLVTNFSGTARTAYEGGSSDIKDRKLKQILTELLRPRRNIKYIEQVLKNEFFTVDPIVRIMQYFENIHLQEEAQKIAFFEQLPNELNAMPSSLHAQILPHCLDAAKFPALTGVCLPAIVRIGAKMVDAEEEKRQKELGERSGGTSTSEGFGSTTAEFKTPAADLYKEQIEPFILNCFKNNDRALRYRLLIATNEYATKVDRETVRGKIFADACAGFGDQNSSLREATIKAMVSLAPVLDPAVVQDRVAKSLMKCLKDVEPSIRTNTVICFGKIAPYMSSPGVVLRGAFGTALNDPFPPARSSALNAMLACDREGYFTIEDICQHLIPAVSRHVIDPEKDIQELAMQTLGALVQQLRSKISTAEQTASSGPESGSSGAPANKAEADTTSQTWGGWAMSRFSGKVTGKMDSGVGAGTSEHTSKAAVATIGAPPPPTGGGGTPPVPLIPKNAPIVHSVPLSSGGEEDPFAINSDGWDNDDDLSFGVSSQGRPSGGSGGMQLGRGGSSASSGRSAPAPYQQPPRDKATGNFMKPPAPKSSNRKNPFADQPKNQPLNLFGSAHQKASDDDEDIFAELNDPRATPKSAPSPLNLSGPPSPSRSQSLTNSPNKGTTPVGGSNPPMMVRSSAPPSILAPPPSAPPVSASAGLRPSSPPDDDDPFGGWGDDDDLSDGMHNAPAKKTPEKTPTGSGAFPSSRPPAAAGGSFSAGGSKPNTSATLGSSSTFAGAPNPKSGRGPKATSGTSGAAPKPAVVIEKKDDLLKKAEDDFWDEFD